MEFDTILIVYDQSEKTYKQLFDLRTECWALLPVLLLAIQTITWDTIQISISYKDFK